MKYCIVNIILILIKLPFLYSQQSQVLDVVYNMTPQAITIGKINSDELNDIVIGSGIYESDLAWYENTGENTAYIPHQLNSYGMHIHNLKLGDLDNDGDNDIVTAGDGEDKILIYKQVSTDSFWVQKTEYADSTDTFDETSLGIINLMDVDDDHDLDIVFFGEYTSGHYELGWLENQSDTAVWKFHTILKDHILGKLLCYDFNNDGLTDIVCPLTAPDGFIFLQNTGSGFLSDTIEYAYTNLPSFSAFDYDGDNDIDIMMLINHGVWDYSLEILVNESGEFSSANIDLADSLPDGIAYLNADYDNDGDDDIIYDTENSVKLMKNDGYGNFEEAIIKWDSLNCDFINFLTADLNNDTLPDFLLEDQISQDITFAIFPLINTGASLLNQNTAIYNFSWFYDTQFMNANNDLAVDIISGLNMGINFIYFLDPPDNYSSKTGINQIDASECDAPYLVRSGDINNDNYDDFIGIRSFAEDYESCKSICSYVNNADSTFSEIQILSDNRGLQSAGGVINAFLQDIDYDEDLDFCAITTYKEDEFSSTHYYISFYVNEGGHFTDLQDIYSTTAVNSYINSLNIADIDLDGDFDILFLDTYEGEILLLENLGSLNFAEPQILFQSDSIVKFNMLNANGDNFKDIIFSSHPGDQIYVMYNTDGEFSDTTLVNHADLYYAIIYDLDNDGLEDVIFNNTYIHNSAEFGLTGMKKFFPQDDYIAFRDVNYNNTVDILHNSYDTLEIIYDYLIDTSYTAYNHADSITFQLNSLLIYPNPGNGTVNVKNIIPKDITVWVANELGEGIEYQLIFMDESSVVIQLQNAVPGIYFLTLFDGHKFNSAKLIVSN